MGSYFGMVSDGSFKKVLAVWMEVWKFKLFHSAEPGLRLELAC